MKKEIDLNKIPYFEMKVVKVKGEKKCRHDVLIFCADEISYVCDKCGKVFFRDYLGRMFVKKPKGDWVNGENLDKIKFPCFCSYSNDKEKGIGFLSVDNGYYYIANINFQKKTQEDIKNSHSDLKAFVIKNNIHILKGKIIIYKEE